MYYVLVVSKPKDTMNTELIMRDGHQVAPIPNYARHWTRERREMTAYILREASQTRRRTATLSSAFYEVAVQARMVLSRHDMDIVIKALADLLRYQGVWIDSHDWLMRNVPAYVQGAGGCRQFLRQDFDILWLKALAAEFSRHNSQSTYTDL